MKKKPKQERRNLQKRQALKTQMRIQLQESQSLNIEDVALALGIDKTVAQRILEEIDKK